MPVAAKSGRSILNTLKKTFHYFLSPTTAFTVSSISSNVQSNGGHLWKKGCCGFMQDIFTMRLPKSNFSEKSPISRCASFRFFILSSSLRSSSFDFLTSYKKSIVCIIAPLHTAIVPRAVSFVKSSGPAPGFLLSRTGLLPAGRNQSEIFQYAFQLRIPESPVVVPFTFTVMVIQVRAIRFHKLLKIHIQTVKRVL